MCDIADSNAPASTSEDNVNVFVHIYIAAMKANK